jgi:hypothetical protein
MKTKIKYSIVRGILAGDEFNWCLIEDTYCVTKEDAEILKKAKLNAAKNIDKFIKSLE